MERKTPIPNQHIVATVSKAGSGQGEQAAPPRIRAGGALTVARSFLIFVLCFGLFMWPWPGLNHAYGRFFRGMAVFFLPAVGTHGRCEYIPVGLEGSASDIKINLINKRTGVGVAHNVLSSRYFGYVPTALVAALVLASPIGWRRRGWAMLWGMLGINVFVLLKLLVLVLYEFAGLSGYQDLMLFSPGRVTAYALAFAHLVLIASPAGGFVIPIVVWALATFRRRDWNQLLARTVPVGRGRLHGQ